MAQLKHFLQATIEEFQNQRERYILWIPVFIAIGIGFYFSLSSEPYLWTAITCLISVTSILTLARHTKVFNICLLILFLIVLGFTAACYRTISVNTVMLHKKLAPVMVAGTIQEIDNLPENKGWKVILSNVSLDRLSQEKTPRRIRLQIYKKSIKLKPEIGQRIKVLSILNAPSPPVMPNAFDFRRYMFFENIGATGFVIGKTETIRNKESKTSFWEKKRITIKNKIDKALPDNYVVSSLMSALLTGERGAVTEETWEYIRSSGLAHLLAISGLHIGLIAGFIFFTIRALLALSETIALKFSIKKISAATALAFTVGYLFLVGSPVSAERATIMTGIILIAIIFDREGMTLRLAAIAASVILLSMPEALLSAGFHMSFAAVVSLIAFYEALSPYWREWYRNSSFIHRIALYVLGSVLTTIIASLATAPFSLFHFHRVADEMSLLANIAAVPITSFIVMPAGIISLLLMPFNLEYIPLQIMGKGVEIIYNIAKDISTSGNHMISSPAWSLSSLIIMTMGGLWLSIWRRKIRIIGIIPISIGLLIAIQSTEHTKHDIYVSNNGNVTAIKLENDEFLLSSIRKDKFITENWIKKAGSNKNDTHKWLENGEMNGNFSCNWMYCEWNKNHKQIAFIKNPTAFIKTCAGYDVTNKKYDIVIAPKDVIPKNCILGIKIDRFDLWNNGAYTLDLQKDKVIINNVKQALGNRPWVIDQYKNKWKNKYSND